MTSVIFHIPNDRSDSRDLIHAINTWSPRLSSAFPGTFYLGELSKIFEVTASVKDGGTLVVTRPFCTPVAAEKEFLEKRDVIFGIIIEADKENTAVLVDLNHLCLINKSDFIFSLPIAERKTHLILGETDGNFYLIDGDTAIVYALNYYGKWLSPSISLRAPVFGKTLIISLCASFGGFNFKESSSTGVGALDFPKGKKDKTSKIPAECLKELDAFALSLRAHYEKKTPLLPVVGEILLSDILITGVTKEMIEASQTRRINVVIDRMVHIIKEIYITSGVTYLCYLKDADNILKYGITAQISAPNLVILN